MTFIQKLATELEREYRGSANATEDTIRLTLLNALGEECQIKCLKANDASVYVEICISNVEFISSRTMAYLVSKGVLKWFFVKGQLNLSAHTYSIPDALELISAVCENMF